MTAKLLGIEMGRGTCDHCDRELSLHRFRVNVDGETLTLGRRCAAKATGFNPAKVDHEAQRIARLALTAERRGTVSSAFPGLDAEQVGEIATADYLWRQDTWRGVAQDLMGARA